MATTIEAVRAEALFASTLQSSETPASGEIRAAVAVTLRQIGIQGCAARVASEFGDHPETAVARMVWALAQIRATYPAKGSKAIRAIRAMRRPGAVIRPLALTA
ncbi:hypothetical protein Drose_37330 [Dactylosporangium roseum]|uniref:Uncharacterized protein n=1 Tax=Dactylosporangium roseum TaxID=47989 RepID=A0ABY5Z797_9ACTN|nr:hypothetical protein [Dactylosporangium roseum]UWZ36603.1 hypothetical protein Drose_37330 [Dactylosporangium roseum]